MQYYNGAYKNISIMVEIAHNTKGGEIPKQVTHRKTIKRTFFNISSNLAHFTDNFKTDLT